MSILSQINRITGEVSAQTELLTQITNALQGKSISGSASTDTCSITLADNYIERVLITQLIDGAITSRLYTSPAANTVFDNVVCGSCFAFLHSTGAYYVSTTSENITTLATCASKTFTIMQAPSVHGQSGTVYVYTKEK